MKKRIFQKIIIVFALGCASCNTPDSRSCVRAMMEDHGYSPKEAKEMCDDMHYETHVR